MEQALTETVRRARRAAGRDLTTVKGALSPQIIDGSVDDERGCSVQWVAPLAPSLQRVSHRRLGARNGEKARHRREKERKD